jgi:hypothetical protein
VVLSGGVVGVLVLGWLVWREWRKIFKYPRVSN